MASTIIAFRSRNDSLKFFETIKSAGIPAGIINTPKEAMLGCGLSVAFSEEHLALVRQIYSGMPYKYTFLGFFRMLNVNNRNIVIPI